MEANTDLKYPITSIQLPGLCLTRKLLLAGGFACTSGQRLRASILVDDHNMITSSRK